MFQMLSRKLLCRGVLKLRSSASYSTSILQKCDNNSKNLLKVCFQVCNYSTSEGSHTFQGTPDIFNGITVDTLHELGDPNQFRENLESSLTKWLEEKRRCIWFKVYIRNSFCVPLLADKGFNFHHARDDFVMMYKWLPSDAKPNLPPSAHTNLGVGAMVFNNKDQILAISEKHYDYPHWKLPGGYVEKGEDIIVAAIREVKEETGVEAKFQSLVTFRHTHKMMFGNSDIYVLLRMNAVTEKITISNREVNECVWMEINKYINHPHVHEWNRLVVMKALEHKERGLKLDIQKKTVKWAKNIREMNVMMIEDL